MTSPEGIVPKSPPPKQRSIETDNKLAWMYAHPQMWLQWAVKRYAVRNKIIEGPAFERAYRKEDGKWATYARYIGEGKDVED